MSDIRIKKHDAICVWVTSNTALSKELYAKEEEHHDTREFGFSSLRYPGVEGIKSNAKPKNEEYVKKMKEMK